MMFVNRHQLQQTIQYYLQEAQARANNELESNMYKWQADDTLRLVLYLENELCEDDLIQLIEETPFRDVQDAALEILHNPNGVKG